MKKLMVLLGLAFLCSSLFASSTAVQAPQANFTGTLVVRETADTNLTAIGSTITLKISILNNGSMPASAYVEQGLGNVEPVTPLPVYMNITDNYTAAHPPLLTWTVDISPGEAKELSYQVKPRTVGPLSIGPASVWVGNKVFYSNGLIIQVSCTGSSTCEESIGEDALTCPSKCAGANATGNTTPSFQPVLIPTEPVEVPNAAANLQEIQAEEKQLTDEENNRIFMWIGGIVLVILLLVTGYFIFIRKRQT